MAIGSEVEVLDPADLAIVGRECAQSAQLAEPGLRAQADLAKTAVVGPRPVGPLCLRASPTRGACATRDCRARGELVFVLS